MLYNIKIKIIVYRLNLVTMAQNQAKGYITEAKGDLATKDREDGNMNKYNGYRPRPQW